MRGASGEILELDIASDADLLSLDAELEERYGDAFEAAPVSSWLLADTAFPESYGKARQEKERFLGGVAIRGEADHLPTTETNNASTLMTAIQEAARGDKQALTVVNNNVATDVAERLFKAAHQTRIRMRIEGGKLRQAGRNLTDLHRNAFEHTILNGEMLRRTKKELHNALLFEQLHGAGVLKTHDAVVFSPSPTAMTQKQKKDYNFFLDTETCSIQKLSADGDEVVFESAFVAGKSTPNSERHDIAAIRKLAAERGIEITTDDGTEMIRHVFLIPKEQVGGIEDVVRWYDDVSGGTFYGEDKPRQDYKRYAVECEERSNGFSGMVQAITAQLIAEAPTFRTALDANIRLDELSEQYSVKRAVNDKTINEAVFGKQAAMHIQEARFFMDRGEFDRAEQSLAMAQATADSGSCPWLKNMIRGEGDDNDPSGAGTNNQELGEKKRGHCPFCGATVFVDPCARRISCWDCTATVNNGKVISSGNGGSSKRRSEGKEAEQPLTLVAFTKPEATPELPVEPTEDNDLPSITQQVDAAFHDQGVDSFEAEEQGTQAHPAHAGKLALVGAGA
jgi:hypothetical protein